MSVILKLYYNSEYNEKIICDCASIVSMHHVDNGGTLRRRDLVLSSKYLLCAYFKDEIVGFAALKDNHFLYGDVYISQIAVSNQFLRKGIARKLIDYIIENLDKYQYITASVNRDNVGSNALFTSMGFKRYHNPRLKRSDSYVMDLTGNNKSKKIK